MRESTKGTLTQPDRISAAPDQESQETRIAREDLAYQDYVLQGVSRTFALTIPQLPQRLASVVSNAYLLCRIADTIEDEATLSREQKEEFSDQFIQVVEGRRSSEGFGASLFSVLSEHTLAAERDLIKHAPQVLRITHSYNPGQRRALARCIRIMARGMAQYQNKGTRAGLNDLAALDEYCYYVAGVVGEMLTELFCDYCEELNDEREEMMQLAVSFGQGLQMTNILKDVWEDHARGACWLPRDVFRKRQLDLGQLMQERGNPGFAFGIAELIGIARGHLENALRYTLRLPKREKGMRKFCLWALAMAVLTLRKIHRHKRYSSGKEVKITRASVKATIIVTNLLVSFDSLLKLLFNVMVRDLPIQAIDERNGEV
ncbi:MAG: phytoene/squalene synthase family protein [Gammaproteobacteria bacterium]